MDRIQAATLQNFTRFMMGWVSCHRARRRKNPTVVDEEAYTAEKRRKKQDLGRVQVITFGYRA
jgi:hypothetical protein